MYTSFSFNVKTATSAVQLYIIVLAVLGFMAPLAYFAWWGFYGGHETEIKRAVEKLESADPRQDALNAIAKEDYRLYCIGGFYDPVVPGIGRQQEAYKEIFGYRGFTLIEGKSLTENQRRLNKKALDYMIQFNEIVNAEVNRRFPNRLKEYKEPGY